MHAPSSTAPGFRPLAIVFALFVLFLYGPMITIVVLSFQGPEGGLTFPLRGLSLHWFYKLAEGLGTVDIGAAFRRSLALGVVVMLCTVVLSVLAGLAFRKKLSGGNTLFFVTVASLIMPSIIVSLGIGEITHRHAPRRFAGAQSYNDRQGEATPRTSCACPAAIIASASSP